MCNSCGSLHVAMQTHDAVVLIVIVAPLSQTHLVVEPWCSCAQFGRHRADVTQQAMPTLRSHMEHVQISLTGPPLPGMLDKCYSYKSCVPEPWFLLDVFFCAPYLFHVFPHAP